MRFRLLNPRRRRARHLGVSLGVSLCAGALLVGPLKTAAWAAPTLGGDENGPQVQIVQPAYQDVIKGRAKIVIAVKAQKFNPQSVEMFVDDKAVTDGPIPLANVPSAQFDWPTTFYADGPHKLHIRVTDTQGFRGWAEVNIYINNNKSRDAIPPSLQWMNVEGYQQIAGKMNIEVQTLNNLGVKWLMIGINPASDPNRKPPLRSWFLNKAPYRVEFDSAMVPDGIYSLTAKAWDALEQEGEAAPLTVGVVNTGGINATTVGEMLRTMKGMDKTAKTASTTPKTASPAATAVNRTATNSSSTGSSATTTPNRSAASQNLGGSTTGVQRLQVAKNPAPTRGAQAQLSSRPEIAVPRLAPAAPPENATAAAPKRDLLARAALPELEARPQDSARGVSTPLAQGNAPEASTGANLSEGATLEPRLAGRRELESDAAPDSAVFAANRIAAPTGETRAVEGASSESPILSQNASDEALRLALNVPVKLEAPEAEREGRFSTPATLTPRGEISEDASAPTLSAPTLGSDPVVAPRVAIAPAVEALPPAPARVAAPQITAPQVAAPQTAAQPLAPSAPATTSKGKTRVSALPRAVKPSLKGAITAITVSPLEIKASDAIPAFHAVQRATDVRAVAARYGLPVEVVAACNDWNTTKKLAAGDRVKLPTQLKVSYQGIPVKSDVPSMLVGGTGVAAFRFIFEKQGGTMTWDAKKQRVMAKKGDREVTLSIGSNTAKVGDKDVMMELAAFLFEGRTMVPLRFFEQGLSANVEWDPQTGRLVVAMAN